MDRGVGGQRVRLQGEFPFFTLWTFAWYEFYFAVILCIACIIFRIYNVNNSIQGKGYIFSGYLFRSGHCNHSTYLYLSHPMIQVNSGD